MQQRYISIADAATEAGVHPRSIQRYIARGDLDAVKLSPTRQGRVRIAIEAWRRFLEDRRVGGRAR